MERYDRRSDLQYGIRRISKLIKLGNISQNPTSQLGCVYYEGGYHQLFVLVHMDIV